LQRSSLLLLSVGLLACSGNPDEKAIRKVVEGMRTSAEAKRFEETISAMADDYRDNVNRDRPDLLRRLNDVFAGYERLILKLGIEKVEITGPSAVVWGKIVVMGVTEGRRELLFGSPLGGKKIDLRLAKRAGGWVVVEGNVHFRD
jgi:hypothetical protein